MIVDIFPKYTEAHHDLAADETVTDSPRPGSAWLVGGDVFNPGGSVAYLQVFDAAAVDVVLGTTPPTYALAIPAGAAVAIDPPRPVLFRTALSYAVTATRTGAGAPAAACSMTMVYA